MRASRDAVTQGRAAAGSIGRGRCGQAVWAASLVVAGLLVGAGPVWAHAAGVPPHAQLRADGRVVEVELTTASDDAALIGSSLGLLPERAMEWYLGESDEGEPTDEQLRELSASPELREYLLEHVQIHQDGRRCEGRAEPAADFLVDGAELRFTCAEPVAQADVRITLLHDEDPAYRTYSVDGTIQSYTHTPAQPEHRWDFTLAGQESGGVPVGLLAGLGGVIAGGALLLTRFWRPAPLRRPTPRRRHG